MLNYTGHPFVDVGVATITAFAGKKVPAEVTADDLSAVADYIEQNYIRNPLRAFLTVAFTSNAWFVQDAYNPDRPELTVDERNARRARRKEWADLHLRAWTFPEESSTTEMCVFTSAPVVSGALSGKLWPGRAGRAQIPLLQGDDNINFYPGGDSGVPVSGTALLCLQAFPLGCAKVAGSLLAVHSDDPGLTYLFAHDNLGWNRRAVSLAQHANGDKMPESKHPLGTYLIGTLLRLENERQVRVDEEMPPSSVTAYHLNNGKTPKLDIYQVPIEVHSFLISATSAKYREQWDNLVRRGWELPPQPRGKAKSADPVFEPRRNFLYEDALRLPENAPRFIRLYFLRATLRYAREGDPRREYSPVGEAAFVSWDLAELFLKEVLHMDASRINEIRSLGDRLAAYIRSENDRRFFRTLMTERRPGLFRLALIKTNAYAVQRGREPLVTFDPYIEVFEDGDEVPRRDWSLARDLVLIRVIEQLHSNGWLAGHAEDLGDVTKQLDEQETTLQAAAPEAVS